MVRKITWTQNYTKGNYLEFLGKLHDADVLGIILVFLKIRTSTLPLPMFNPDRVLTYSSLALYCPSSYLHTGCGFSSRENR